MIEQEKKMLDVMYYAISNPGKTIVLRILNMNTSKIIDITVLGIEVKEIGEKK